jgi:isoleucyl-tRNA synthetase
MYEANVLERFADLQEKGLIERGQRPVYWSVIEQKIVNEEELEPKVELRNSIVTKAKIANFGLNS